MDDFFRLNLIALFTFYLTAAFVLSTYRRLRQYRDAAQLVLKMPGRWPRLLRQIREHRVIFLTWTTFRPLLVAISLLLVQWICSRVIFPRASMTVESLFERWWILIPIGIVGAAMLAVDLYFIIRVGTLDRRETEKYLDEAEHWLRSWKAPLVRIFTLGYINPRAIVDVEVRKAMEDTSTLLTQTLWWVSLQAGCRLLFGLMLWGTWFFLPTGQ
jgi:hypothetical protein